MRYALRLLIFIAILSCASCKNDKNDPTNFDGLKNGSSTVDTTNGTDTQDTDINGSPDTTDIATFTHGGDDSSEEGQDPAATTSEKRLFFDGEDDYLNLWKKDYSGSAITIEGRFYSSDLLNCDSGDCRIISMATGVRATNHYLMVSSIKQGPDFLLRFRLKTNSGDTTTLIGTAPIENKTWYYFAATYDGTTMNLFLDGKQIGSTAKTGDITPGNGIEIWIGGNPPDPTSRPFKGFIENIRIWKKALSADEIAANATEMKQATPSEELYFHFPLNEGDGNQLKDANNDASSIEISGGNFSPSWQSTDPSALTDPPPDDTDATPRNTPNNGEVLLHDQKSLRFTRAHNGFLPLINPGDAIPMANWLSPDDYYNGGFHVRYVIEGPANQAAGKLQLCIWTMGNLDGDGKNYFPESCSGHTSHDGPGTVYNDRLVPSKWWVNKGTPVDFSHPERFLIRVVLRGAAGCNVTRHNVNRSCWDEWAKYKDMKFRTTIVMTPKGVTFSGWENYP